LHNKALTLAKVITNVGYVAYQLITLCYIN